MQQSDDPLAQSFQDYHRQLILGLCQQIRATPPFLTVGSDTLGSDTLGSNAVDSNTMENDTQTPQENIIHGGEHSAIQEELQENVLNILDVLSNQAKTHEELAEAGQWLINTIVAAYPHLTPHVPRDLFWYFGGDCMHFLGDEEIAYFQAIDEALYLARTADGGPQSYSEVLKMVAGQSQNMH